MLRKVLSFIVFITAINLTVSQDLFELSVIHLNDFHARFEQTTPKSTPCRPGDETTCIGGIARVVTEITRLMVERQNPLLLNAGDNYQGTLYFNMFGYQLIADVLNTLPFHVHTLGNHEFDRKVLDLVHFIEKLKAPVVVANMDDSMHPEIQGLYQKSVVIEIGGKKIGIVGVIYPKTNEISNTENIKFLDESDSVNAEADRLAKEEKVFTVVVLSHCGYDLDKEMARKARSNIGLIVGAHTHTLLYRGEAPDAPVGGSVVEGYSPSIIKRADGGNVYVVQASCYTKYLGSITVKYDSRGQVKGWIENDDDAGLPIYMGHDIVPDPTTMDFLAPYIEQVQVFGNRKIGETLTVLEKQGCGTGECTLGNMVTDGMLSTPFTNDAYASFMNAGGLRTSIEIGDILYYDLATAQPFENTFDAGVMNGTGIRACAEQMATPYWESSSVNILQVSGLRITLDLSKPEGERVTSLEIRQTPGSTTYEVVNDAKEYKVSTVSFLTNGGDGFTCFPDYFTLQKQGLVDVKVLEKYITDNSPLDYKIENRIVINAK